MKYFKIKTVDGNTEYASAISESVANSIYFEPVEVSEAEFMEKKKDELNEVASFMERGKVSGKVRNFDDFILEFVGENPEDDDEEHTEDKEEEHGGHNIHGEVDEEEDEMIEWKGKEINKTELDRHCRTKNDCQNEINRLEKEGRDAYAEEIDYLKSKLPDAPAYITVGGSAADDDDRVGDDSSSKQYYDRTLKEAANTGYGDLKFVFFKNGDTANYFFKMGEGDKHRCYVLSIGKFSKYGHPVNDKAQYGVLDVTELEESALDQAVMDKGVFKDNENQIEMEENQLISFFKQVAACVTDYLQKDPKCNTFFDEMQDNLKNPNYDNQMAVSTEEWPGGRDTWKMQVVEKGKLNTISK